MNIAASLPDKLSYLYARFEAHNTAHTESAAAEEASALSISVADVTQSFDGCISAKLWVRMASHGGGLKACTFQLAGPTLCKIKSHAWLTGGLLLWHPSSASCFDKLVRDYICSVLPASLDPLQFAYCSNHSTDDATAFTLHTALSHLENKNTYVRMLFVDYCSAFNTIVPATLGVKLQTLGLNRSLCSWILDFLTGRSQVVRMGNNTSSPLIRNTGAPQGCVLSPLLYSLYTHDCTIVKFADDTMW